MISRMLSFSVQELDGRTQMEQSFHTFVGHQSVSAAGAFMDVVTCAGDPVVFLVTQPLQDGYSPSPQRDGGDAPRSRPCPHAC